jgi:Ca2+-binding RTX toxin-like protein
VADFIDGTDSIGLDTITYGALTIAQVGSDTVIKEGSNFLTTLTGISASSITAVDFQSTSTSAVTYTGTSDNDTIVGGAGTDTFNGGAGSDTLLGWGGNDTFNIRSKSGTYVDTITGGAGTDTLNISYTGVNNLGDFVISVSGDSFTLTDSSGGTITFSGIETLIVGDYTYTHIQTDRGSSPEQQKAYWNATEKALYLYDGSNLPSSIWSPNESNDTLPGLTFDMDVTVIGSAGTNSFNLNIDRAGYYYRGDWTMDLKGGDDTILSAKLKDADSIDMGSGDDTVYVMLSGSNGTPALGSANITKLDGGTGTDTLAFTESTVAAGSTLTLTTANATNFENLIGSNAVETLNGDNNANTIKGDGGADTINGNGGNDILVASGNTLAGADSATTNDNLYGGSGNDTLNGTAGDNILDGGTGADTIYSGGGSDTIIIRSGDGGSSIEDADVITDFSDTNDIVGLSGLNFSDVTPQQGPGSYSSHVIVKENSTGNFLVIIQNQSIGNIDDNDFSAI